MRAITVIKFVGTWTCIILAAGFVILGPPRPPIIAQTITLIAIAFALAPSNW